MDPLRLLSVFRSGFAAQDAIDATAFAAGLT